MIAKKISITISIILFILGILLAFALSTFIEIANFELRSLLINICIGISTGGLVAFLIEWPFTTANIKSNKDLLKSKGLSAYISCVQLVYFIDEVCQRGKEPISEKIYTHFTQKISEFAMPLLSLDPFIYFYTDKQKQLANLIQAVDIFIMQHGMTDLFIINTIDKLREQCLRPDKNEAYFSALEEAKKVLNDTKNKVLPLLNSINDTMDLVLSKRDFETWKIRKQFADEHVFK